MAEPEKTQEPSKIGEGSATPATSESKAALPQVESPSLSPAGFAQEAQEPAFESMQEAEPEKILAAIEAAQAAQPKAVPRFAVSRRMRRNGLLAASVMLAAATGAVIGALAVGTTAPPAATGRADTAGNEERASMQKSIAHLAKEISALKSGIEAANKGTGSQIGKIADRVERIEKHDRTADTTGTINKSPAPAAAPAAVEAPLPTPRPNILNGWILRDAANGRAVVENRSGDYYDVRPGDPLPGLGNVEAIKRDAGRWQVVTGRGIITGATPATTASVPPRRRSYYSPYYWPY
jgi:hypothetical protein